MNQFPKQKKFDSYRSESAGLALAALISFFSVFNPVNKDFLFFIIDSVYNSIVP